MACEVESFIKFVNGSNKMKYIKLKLCIDVLEANIIKGHLENEGIQCYIANEHISNLLPSISIIKGEGPQIMVLDDDFERAEALISEQDDFETEFENNE